MTSSVVVVLALLLPVAGFLFVCWHRMRSTGSFEGELGNRYIKIRFASHRAAEETPPRQAPPSRPR